MHLKAGFILLWVGFFTTQELTHLMYHPCEAPLIDIIVYSPLVSLGMLTATFSLGNVDIGKKPNLLLLRLSWFLT